MSQDLDKKLASYGTRFLIYSQPRFLPSFVTPETIHVSVPVGKVSPGPADDRMFVVDAVNKRPYSGSSYPPYSGESNPPVPPGPDGHFDHLSPGTREFRCATMYATVRRVLDIWEDYFGRKIEWYFRGNFPRMELIALAEWDNAQSGYGFLEFGYSRTFLGGLDRDRPYCENFDVLAHELGHAIISAEMGTPADPNDEAVDFNAMHESAGDLVAIVAALHSDRLIDILLGKSHGNLFSANELSRIGELSKSRDMRSAFNSLRLSDVGSEPHDRSEPLTGAAFDVLIEIYQKKLVEKGLIPESLAKASTQGPGGSTDFERIQYEFDNLFEGKAGDFKAALLFARDYFGQLLARTWQHLSPNFLTYADVLRALLDADAGRYEQTIRECFEWREIMPTREFQLRFTRRLVDCGIESAHRAKRPAAAASRTLAPTPDHRTEAL